MVARGEAHQLEHVERLGEVRAAGDRRAAAAAALVGQELAQREQDLPHTLGVALADREPLRDRAQQRDRQFAVVVAAGVAGLAQERGHHDRREQQRELDRGGQLAAGAGPGICLPQHRAQRFGLVGGAGLRQVRVQLRQDDLEDPGLEHQLERRRDRAAAEHPQKVLDDPRRGGAGDLVTVGPDRPQAVVVDAAAEPGGQAHRAQHPDRVLAHADVRVADGPHDAALDVGHAADVVQDHLAVHVVEQRVEREVPPPRVLLGRAEDVVVADQLDFVGRGLGHGQRRAERRDLDDLLAEVDVGQPEAAADDPAVAKQAPDLVRVRRRGDVEVLGAGAEQKVAHAAADEVGLVARAGQPRGHARRVGVEFVGRHRPGDLEQRGFRRRGRRPGPAVVRANRARPGVLGQRGAEALGGFDGLPRRARSIAGVRPGLLVHSPSGGRGRRDPCSRERPAAQRANIRANQCRLTLRLSFAMASVSGISLGHTA